MQDGVNEATRALLQAEGEQLALTSCLLQTVGADDERLPQRFCWL